MRGKTRLKPRADRAALPPAFSAGVALLGVVAALTACAGQSHVRSGVGQSLPHTISGVVSNAVGPVAGAIVQVQGTPNQTTTRSDGAFTLHGQGLGGNRVVTVTAWAEDHFVGWVSLDPANPVWQAGGAGVQITLKPLYTVDNTAYKWFTFEGVSGSASCGICHREYEEWQADAHAQSAVNPRFITMYRGTNVAGQPGQPTRLTAHGQALPPDPSQPYYGPGFRLDNPDRAGNCATCHTPVAANTPNDKNCAWSGCHTSATAERAQTANGLNLQGIMPVGLMGIGEEGVACEFCHKVGNVILDPATKLPYPDMPGILSMKLYRPPEGQQLFFGTLVDVSRRVSYLPLQSQSAFCAPCHFGVIGGVVGNGMVSGGALVYNSYGEWLNSAWSDPQTGKTCQNCHMPAADTVYTVFPEKGGIQRDYVTYHQHTMRGVSDLTLMWSAVTLTSTATRQGDALQVNVQVTNDKTGHNVPTDQPMRSVMLVVEVSGPEGRPVSLQRGPTLPDWTGNYAGQPGRAFAQVLRDEWTGETPTAAMWRDTTVVEDTRLAPFAASASNFTFALPAGRPATVKVRLIYRRAFQQLAQQKGWNDPDITMAEQVIAVEQ